MLQLEPAGFTAAQWDMFAKDLAIAAAFMSTALALGKILEHGGRMDRKGVSYVMSLLNAGAMTASAAWTFMPRFLEVGFDLERLFLDSRLSRFACTFFLAFCLLDLLLGSVCYREQVELLTGWIHHLAYAWLMWHVLWHHISDAFCLFLVEELPTFLLALGNVSRPLRTNWLFGGSFFVTRLVWHGYLLWAFLSTRGELPITLWPLVLATFGLHAHWFSGWTRQQVRRLRKRAKAKAD